MSEDTDYELRAHDSFEDGYEEMQKKGNLDAVNRGLEKIQDNPKKNSKHLKGKYEGKRSHRTDPIRIIFASCEECIKRGDTEKNDCKDCHDIHGENHEDPEDVIKLFETGLRSNIY